MALLWLIVAVLLLAVAAYVQLAVPRFTAGRARTTTTRAVLALVGIAFGFTAAATSGDTALAAAAFVIGFGAVHVPAAFILFFKRQRGEGRS